MEERGEQIELTVWRGPWPDDDPDANFKADVALYCLEDPVPMIRRLAESTDIPPGAIVRYILARWASAGSETLLSAGPAMIERMWDVVEEAEASGSDEAKLDAFETLTRMIAWLRIPLSG